MAGGALALLIAIIAASFWPGVAEYDTVAQYQQVLGDPVDDWHPPIMIRLWQALHPLAAGTAPMFALQVGLYTLGFGLIVAALVRSDRWRAGVCAALLAFSPLMLGWQMVVLKDGQMSGALVTAVGLVAHYRLRERAIPLAAALLIALLLAYATLVRGNAVFATAPLAVLLLSKPVSMLSRGALIAATILAVLALSPLINQRLLGATPSGIAKSQPIFDLATIALDARDPAPFTDAERQELRDLHCVKTFFWDPLGDPTACGAISNRLKERSEASLYGELARGILAHPIAYARHRLEHWNSTERWLVPPGLIVAGPPDEAEPNSLSLNTPTSPLVEPWQDAAGVEAATPLGWPITWTVMATLLLPTSRRRRAEPEGGVALALIASALLLEVSFLVISIASDLRYHLWSMTASALALILLGANIHLRSRSGLAGVGMLTLVIAAGSWTRVNLPKAPATYQGMIHAPTG